MVRMADPSPYRVCFVCSGNICRSPMAEAVLRELAERAGIGSIEVDSAGTGDWHIGERADLRTLRALADAGYPPPAHRARQFDTRWFGRRDLVIALDAGHERTLRAWAPDATGRASVRLLRSFDPALGPEISGPEGDVPDPYYGDDSAFTEVLHQIEAACAGLVAQIRAGTAPRSAGLFAHLGDPQDVQDVEQPVAR
jgi:protein-tyrosine phosphatase